MELFTVGSMSDAHRAAIAAVAGDLGCTLVTGCDLAGLPTNDRFLAASRSMVLLAGGSARTDVPAAVAFAQEQAGRTFVAVIADTIAPEDYKRLIRTGAADWITWRDLDEELRDLVSRSELGGGRTRATKVLCFVPSKGGVGNTTLAIESAFHLTNGRRRRDARVAIFDLNLQGGTIADALDIEPRFDVSEIVDRPERLDEQLVDIFTSRHSPRLDVFASPANRIDPGTVKPEIIFAFIDAIASRYDVVLFDLPVVWLPWTDGLLSGSDAVVVSGTETVPALRRLASTLSHLDTLPVGADKVAAVVNTAEADLLGRVNRRAVVERALGARRIFFVRRDGQSAANALDVGQPMLELAPNSRIGRDIRQLAGWLDGKVDGAPKERASATPRRGGAA